MLKGGDRVRIQTEIVKFIALPFPFSSNLVAISRRTVVVQGQQKKLQKRVMHEQSRRQLGIPAAGSSRCGSFVRSLVYPAKRRLTYPQATDNFTRLMVVRIGLNR